MSSRRILIVTLLMVVGYWIFEAAIDSIFFYSGNFIDLAFTNVPVHELYQRITFSSFALILGLFLSRTIAERVRIQNELGASESRYRDLFLQSPIGLYTTSPDGDFIDANPALLEMLGYPDMESLIEVKAVDLYKDPQEHERQIKAIDDTNILRDYELCLLRRDGSEVWVRDTVFARRNSKGEIIEYQGGSQDISEQKKIASKLAKSERLLMFAINQMPIPVMLAAPPDGKILFINQAATDLMVVPCQDPHNINSQDMRRYWPTFTPQGETLPVKEFPLIRAVRHGEITTGKEVIIRHPDQDHWVNASAAPLRDESGQIIAGLVVFPDISEQRAARHKLKEYSLKLEEMVASRTKELENLHDELLKHEKLAFLGQLSGSIGHELRNPLGVIANAAFFLKMYISDEDETVNDYLNIITDEIHTAEHIIDDLLSFARSNKSAPRKHKVADLFSHVLEKHPPPRGIRINNTIPVDFPPIYIDPSQLRQVINNLLSNAYQSMPEGGMVTLSASVNNNSAILEIHDTGVGIPNKNLPLLFDPLFSTRDGGIGLGLSVCKLLIGANQGDIQVESIYGEGTTLRLKLPLANISIFNQQGNPDGGERNV